MISVKHLDYKLALKMLVLILYWDKYSTDEEMHLQYTKYGYGEIYLVFVTRGLHFNLQSQPKN